MSEGAAELEAIRALLARGIDGPEYLLNHATPEAIVRTCEWWDTQTGVGPGLLVNKCKAGGVSEALAPSDGLTEKQRKRARLLEAFAEKCELFPVGSVVAACGCGGELVVIRAGSVTGEGADAIEVRCDQCVDELGITPKAARRLPAAPLATGRAEPAAGEACPADGSFAHPRRQDPAKGPQRLDFAKVAAKCEPELERVAA